MVPLPLFLTCLFPLSHSTRLLAATTLRNVLGTRNLAEILSERESISKVMQDALDEATDSWGVKVTEETSPNLLHLFLFTGRESGDVSKYSFYKNINSYHRIYLQ